MHWREGLYDAVRLLADRALRLAKRNETPPTPRIYEVWFTYASGKNACLTARIEALFKRYGRIPTAEIERLHAEVLSPDATARGVERLGAGVEVDVHKLADYVASAAAKSHAVAEEASAIGDAAAATLDRDALGTLARQLASCAGRHAKSAEALGTKLEISRQRLMAMRQELQALRAGRLGDEVTGLSNHEHFELALAELIENAVRSSGEDLQLLLIEIEDFDRLCHQWGRRAATMTVLRLAEGLRAVAREEDVVARLDRDLFALAMPYTQAHKAEARRDALRGEHGRIEIVLPDTGDCLGHVHVRFGLAGARHDDTVQALSDRAEEALMRERLTIGGMRG